MTAGSEGQGLRWEVSHLNHKGYSLPPPRGPIGLRFALATSAIAIFLVLVCACILRFGTSSLCKSIISLNMTR